MDPYLGLVLILNLIILWVELPKYDRTPLSARMVTDAGREGAERWERLIGR